MTFRGAPGRGSSTRPSSRGSRNRRRHLPTVCGQIPSSAATSWLVLPSAQPSTIRHRCANACDDFARRAHRCSVSRSSSDNTTSATGRPLRAIRQSCNYSTNFRRTTLRRTTLGGTDRSTTLEHDHQDEDQLNPLLEYDTTGEQCPACDHVHDVCPYHRGLEDGRAPFAQSIAFLNAAPEQINGVLALARRRDIHEP